MLRRAWRRLVATPVFTTFAVLSLALGVGVTTAVYSAVLFLTRTSLNIPDPSRVALVTSAAFGRAQERATLSYADYDDLRLAAPSLGPLAASATFYQSLINDDAVSRLALGEAVTGEYFSHLQLTPFQGRLIQPSDDAAPSRVAVISHLFWRSNLGGADAVGKTLRIGGEPFEIVGVAPKGFGGLNEPVPLPTDVWVPLGSATMFPNSARPPDDLADRRRGLLTVLVRVPESGELPQLAAEVAALGARLDEAHPIERRLAANAAPVKQPRAWSLVTVADVVSRRGESFGRGRVVVTGIVGLVLVVACTNLANLVLARGAARRHELAVRRALGASRAQLILDQLAETSLVALLGGLGAWVVARVLIVWFGSATLPLSTHQIVQLEPVLDWATVSFAAVSMLAALVVFGVAPAWHLSRADIRPALAAEGGGTGHLRWRTKRVLIAVQVMISLSFFLIAAFAARVHVGEHRGPAGIDVERLAIGTLNFSLPPWTETTAREAVERLMTLPLASAPGVESIAVTSGMPFGLFTPIADLSTPEKPFVPNQWTYPDGVLLAATPSIFATLGVPILRGRALDARDTATAPLVAVVSELTASRVFGTTDVLGRTILIRRFGVVPETIQSATIVGLAADTDTQERYSRRIGSVYVPLAQRHDANLLLVARARGEPAGIVPAVRSLVRTAHSDLVLAQPRPAEEQVMGAYVVLGIVSRVAAALAILALALSMAGLFGVLSHLVSGRTREMGVRMALGADAGQIHRLVLRDGLRPVVSGLIMGFILGILARWLFLLSYDASITIADALVFALAPVPILASAVFACYWPARRAARVEPNVALRNL